MESQIRETIGGRASVENVRNLDETGCFWHALVEHGLEGKVPYAREEKWLNKDLQ